MKPDVLSMLDNRSVVSFELSDDRSYVLATEECDRYYNERLDASEMDRLIEQLQEMRGRMAQ